MALWLAALAAAGNVAARSGIANIEGKATRNGPEVKLNVRSAALTQCVPIGILWHCSYTDWYVKRMSVFPCFEQLVS
jgi:hypothetical protein